MVPEVTIKVTMRPDAATANVEVEPPAAMAAVVGTAQAAPAPFAVPEEAGAGLPIPLPEVLGIEFQGPGEPDPTIGLPPDARPAMSIEEVAGDSGGRQRRPSGH